MTITSCSAPSFTRYTCHGCRCDACRAYNRENSRRWREANKGLRWLATPAPQPATPVPAGRIVTERPAWQDQAACLGMDVHQFYSDHSGTQRRVAKAICYGCPIQAECLAAARARREEHGIWGGANFGDEARDRRRIRRQRRTEAAA